MSVIRLKEVAAEAGVSVSTASSALRGLHIVKPETRERVETAARKLGYHKNSAAAVLSSLQTRDHRKAILIAWLSAKDAPSAVSRAGACSAAEKAGVRIDFCDVESPASLQSTLRILEARGCDGIVLGRGMSPVVNGVDWTGFSVVSTEESLFEKGIDVVCSSLFRSTIDILRQVKQAGYRRIGICLREHDFQHPDDETRLGAAMAFQACDLQASERVPLQRLSFSQPDSGPALVDWVKKNSPDVVVGFSDVDLWHLQSGGFSVPKDLAYVALHVSPSNRGMLAGYQENRSVYPQYAVQILLEKIRHGVRGLSGYAKQTLVLPPIFEGASCPALHPRSRITE
jgi:LacI family transcriptional regulator